MNIFISSTFYDYRILRELLSDKLEDIGHDTTLHENDDVFYDPTKPSHVSCIDAVERSDILILIIGSRFGGASVKEVFTQINIKNLKDKSNFKNFFTAGKKYSITQCEYLKAVENNIPVIPFVEKTVWEARHTYQKIKNDPGIDVKSFPFFDNPEENAHAVSIFEFINFINGRKENNAIKVFERAEEIVNYLKNYLSEFFKKVLQISKDLRQEEIILLPTKFPLEKLINFFYLEGQRKRSIQTVITRIHFDENCHCEYEAEIKIKPIDTITHYHYESFSDKKGNVTVEEFEIFETPSDAEYFGFVKDKVLRLNLFFNQPKTDIFTIIVKLEIENYLSNLLEKGEGTLSRSLTNGLKEFALIIEHITFPNTEPFKKLQVEILRHPDISKIGKIVKCKIKDNRRVYNVVFKKEDGNTFKRDTLIKFSFGKRAKNS